MWGVLCDWCYVSCVIWGVLWVRCCQGCYVRGAFEGISIMWNSKSIDVVSVLMRWILHPPWSGLFAERGCSFPLLGRNVWLRAHITAWGHLISFVFQVQLHPQQLPHVTYNNTQPQQSMRRVIWRKTAQILKNLSVGWFVRLPGQQKRSSC